ncbi:MAG: hypothetical protein P4L50_11280 [Anaerolineaceae bacterium]|nr:hypothetical protein [Anaerolineaceae bacterium]
MKKPNSRNRKQRPLRERFEALRIANPLPPATGQKADKAFFDELSGEMPQNIAEALAMPGAEDIEFDPTSINFGVRTANFSDD